MPNNEPGCSRYGKLMHFASQTGLPSTKDEYRYDSGQEANLK